MHCVSEYRSAKRVYLSLRLESPNIQRPRRASKNSEYSLRESKKVLHASVDYYSACTFRFEIQDDLSSVIHPIPIPRRIGRDNLVRVIGFWIRVCDCLSSVGRFEMPFNSDQVPRRSHISL